MQELKAPGNRDQAKEVWVKLKVPHLLLTEQTEEDMCF